MRGSLVWDLPLRMFHWLLALALIGSWITAEAGFEWTPWHFRLGYLALGLILFRCLWGFLGTRHARFGSFLSSPRTVIRYLQDLPGRQASPHVGHNPLGGWSTVLMLLLVAVQATTGLFLSDDIFYAGPYNPLVSNATAGLLAQIHHVNFTLLQVAVALHLSAIAFYAIRKQQNLVGPMISGHKTLSEKQQGAAIGGSRLPLAAMLALAVAIAVTALVLLAPEPAIEDYF